MVRVHFCLKEEYMANRRFSDLLEARWKQDRFLCLGLDITPDDIPARLIDLIAQSKMSTQSALLWLHQKVIDATRGVVCAYKLNRAFFDEQYCEYGDEHRPMLAMVVRYIKEIAPTVPIILDVKWGDIANTNAQYADLAYNTVGVDAITVSPYVGGEALKPFFQNEDKGVFVLCRTSNPGSGEFQNMPVGEQRLFHHVARQVAEEWNEHGTCGLVVGATFPDSIREVRNIAGSLPLLIPGIGPQGGNLEQAVRAGMDSNGEGVLIAVSRSVIHAAKCDDNFVEVHRCATALHDAINHYRKVS